MRRDFLVVAALVGALISVAMAGTARADPTDFGAGFEVRRFSDATLGPNGKKLWASLKSKKQYFGAFSYNVAADTGDTYYNIASLGDAITMAHASCNERTRAEAKRCILYGLALPKGFPARTFESFGLPTGMRETYKSGFLRKAASGKHAVFAMNRLGNNGWAWGYDVAAEAQEAALLSCQSDALQTLAKMEPKDRSVAKGKGMMDCKVVARRGP
jgi:hypothetical protein